MTPQEKAIELYEMFFKEILPYDVVGCTDLAQECALICCDEKLSLISQIEDNYDDAFLGGYKEYLQQVKEEIEKL